MRHRGAINPTMGVLEWGLLVTLSVAWGGSFFLAEVALRGLPPFTVVFGRIGLAAVVLLVLARLAGHRMPCDPRLVVAFLVMGGLNNVIPFSLIVWGQTRIDGGLASILNAATPLFTVVLAHLLTGDERMTPGRAAGVAVGFAGVVAMIGPEALSGLGADVLAQVAVLGAALSYAFAGIYGRRFRDLPPLVTAAGQVTASTVMMVPLVLIADHPWTLPMPGPAVWGAVLGMALISTAAAYVIYFRILATAGATNLLLVTFLIPVTAIVLGAVFLGERLEGVHFAGIASIGFGLAAIDGRGLKALRLDRFARSTDGCR